MLVINKILMLKWIKLNFKLLKVKLNDLTFLNISQFFIFFIYFYLDTFFHNLYHYFYHL
jgi:hypothetical protein